MAKIALLIGISEYEPGLNPLPGAVKDVEAMQRVLAHPEMGGFAEENITVLKNPQRQAIEEAIYKLFDNRQKDDLLLFYFSGHGVKDDSGKLYLSTCKTRKNNGKLVKPSAVAASTLHESINESKSQRQVVILDCCFSGAIAKGMSVKDDGSVNVQEQLGGKGRAILTSSTSTQYSFEQENSELSIYTQYLVEGIEKGAADKDDDGWISVDELHDYASSKVREAAPAMTPEFYPVQEGYRIRLAKSPKADLKIKYRKEFEIIARENEGKISLINRSYLNELQKNLKLLSEEAATIESEVLEPYRQREEKLQRERQREERLQRYEQIFTRVIGQDYPLSQVNRQELKRFQHLWKLTDADVALIEQQALRLRDENVALIEQQALKPRDEAVIPIEQRKKLSAAQLLTRQQFLKLAGLGGAGFTVAMISRVVVFQGNSPQKKTTGEIILNENLSKPLLKENNKEPSLKVFDFDVVTVKGRGKETNRKQAKFFNEDLGNQVALEMVSIPGGKFMMGSPKSEEGRKDRESPQHSVTIQPFFMGKFTVTQAQWKVVAGFPKVKIDLEPNPSDFKGAKRPVEGVNWYDAVEFCARLSKKTGREYRLPSEAEWEYACRAGTTTPFHFGETLSTDLANYNGNYTYGSGSKGQYREQTTDVGSFTANAFGLYDMHGNAWEWCQDTWHENYDKAPNDGSAWISKNANENDLRLLRSGCWINAPAGCRSAYRNAYIPGDRRNGSFGFRLVCAVEWTS